MRKHSNLILFPLLCLASVLIAFLSAKLGVFVSIAVLLILVAVAVLMVVFYDYRLGFLILLTYAFFLFHFSRISPVVFPFGMFIELLYYLILISILVDKYRSRAGGELKAAEKADDNVFKNPIGYAVLLFVIYAFLEMLNPHSTSISARAIAIRETLGILIAYYVVMNVFDSMKTIRLFTKVWLFLALLVALYGMYQEFFGFQPFEIRWANQSPDGLKPMWGRIRKWSFLSDTNAFGLFMSFSALVCFILSLAKFDSKKRIILVISGVIMAVSGSYSGARTAFAMLILGIGIYVLMSINNRNTLVLAAVSVIAFVVIIYGPFYGATINRMRTTFNVSEDASMGVRDMKRVRLQPHARNNPFGVGINTVGNLGLRYEPGHPLSGPFDPDSGYLKMALERGWIGLLINMILYATALVYAVSSYYKAKNNEIKVFYAAYITAFFSLSIAHFTQDAMDQKPVGVIVIATYALFNKLIKFDTAEAAAD